MKRLLIFTSILLILIFIFGEVFRGLALKFDPNEPKAIDVINLKNNDYDIIFMGNSVTQQGINPAIIDSLLGANSYNMAMGGGSIYENELMLRNYLISNKKPKLLVYGMFVNEVSWGGSLRPTFRYNFDKSIRKRYKDHKKNTSKTRDLTTHLNIIPLYRYRVALEHALKFIIDPKGRNYTYYKGFLRTKVTKKVPETLLKHQAGINEDSYRNFMDFAKSKGIKTLVIELPNSKSFNEATTGRDAVLQIIKTESDDGFISFNDNVEQYTPEMWVGVNHFNIKGADKFSAILADALRGYYNKGRRKK